MKIKLLLLTIIIFTWQSYYAQVNIHFDGVKDYENGRRIAYFQISGIQDDVQAYYVQKHLINNENVFRFKIYKGNEFNRKGMFESKSGMNEAYFENKINNIIAEYNNKKNNSVNLREFYLNVFEIDNMPKYIDTGNRQEDVLKFKDKFEKWKQENPKEYNLIRNIQLDIFIQ